MTPLERKELITRVRAMDHEELELVVDNIPVTYCIKRLINEIKRKKNLEQSIKDVINGLETNIEGA